MNILIFIFFLYHANLLFPHSLCAFLQLDIQVLQLITISSNTTRSRINRKDPLEITFGQILVNQVVVKSDALTMLFHSHPPEISILVCQILFLFQYHFQLPPRLNTEL